MENIEIIKRSHDVSNRQDLKAFDTIFAEDFVNRAAALPPINSRKEMLELMKDVYKAFPDWHIQMEDYISEGNKIATRWKVKATHLGAYKGIPPKGKKIVVEGVHMDEIKDNLIQRRWSFSTFMAVIEKLASE